MTRLREIAGTLLGGLLAPATGAGAAVRRARLFHPEGVLFAATVRPLDAGGPAAVVAARLAGPALVRLSGAWWRRREWPDVLGAAIRFRSSPAATVAPAEGDQDLLLATVRRPWTLPLAPLMTNPHDFTANRFHGVSPFEIDGLGVARLRLVHTPLVPIPGDRADRIRAAVRAGLASFRLEARPRHAIDWIPLVSIRLREELELDQQALRFSPFRDGRGIHPTGLVHAMRKLTYGTSQAARPHANVLPRPA